MSKSSISVRLPVTGNGWVEVQVDIADLEMLSDKDRAFILAVLEKLAAFVPVAMGDPEHPASPAKPVPEVLNGLVGGRP